MVRVFQFSLMLCLVILIGVLISIWKAWIDIIPYLSLFISFLGLFVLIPSFIFSEKSAYRTYFRIFAIINFVVWCLFAYDVFSQAHSYWYIYVGMNLFVLMSLLNSWVKNNSNQYKMIYILLYVLIFLTILPVMGIISSTWTILFAKIAISIFSLILLIQGSFRKVEK
jgi:hypothetical protein